ncbi:MAG TPA: chemotaxis protein CheD [Spirochaetota bacterium]|mgnify:CR=1 FL=1|nr:chemotaxis protein CheD [Spirochaetota bacterium]HPJ33815.1 chemotaxis protein CheD [Spirochaetota bacterium]
MLRSQQNRTGKPLYLIYPGEHFASNENCYIGTIVGSCLAVTVFDYFKRVGGLINFVVPGTVGTEGIVHDDISRIGVLNMELLMADMVKLGCDRHHMRVKIFGAGYTDNSTLGKISLPENNIRFVKDYFEFEKIPVEKSDLGGNFRRKLYFSPADGAVYRQILKNNEEFSEFISLEKEYVENEFRNRNRVGKIVLFD